MWVCGWHDHRLAPAVDKIGGHLEEVKVVGKLGTFIFKYRTTGTPSPELNTQHLSKKYIQMPSKT
jgi:hypothetical protein